jgi:hypothetical protein
VRATVQITLAPSDAGTELTWSADAVVGGAVAGVGQRMITGVAKRMADQFFSAVDKELAEPNVVAEVTPVPVAETVPGAAPQTYAPIYGTPTADGWIPTDAKPLLVGAAGGGVLTLLGVWIGYLLGRRS